MDEIQIVPITNEHQAWIRQTLSDNWGSVQLVSRGKIYSGDQLPGFIALHEGQPAGLATYHLAGKHCEIVSLDSLVPQLGIGSALIQAVKAVAQDTGCQRLWLVTTNDNLPAIRFYQKRGFHLVDVHPNSVQNSRSLKPCIPELGLEDIPIRDELEFEILLNPGA